MEDYKYFIFFNLSGNAFQFFYRINNLWHYFKNITYNTIVCCFKEWSFRIFIDDDYCFAPVYTGKMLDGAGDTNCKIQIGCDGDPRLSNMLMMWPPVYICYRAAA